LLALPILGFPLAIALFGKTLPLLQLALVHLLAAQLALLGDARFGHARPFDRQLHAFTLLPRSAGILPGLPLALLAGQFAPVLAAFGIGSGRRLVGGAETFEPARRLAARVVVARRSRQRSGCCVHRVGLLQAALPPFCAAVVSVLGSGGQYGASGEGQPQQGGGQPVRIANAGHGVVSRGREPFAALTCS